MSDEIIGRGGGGGYETEQKVYRRKYHVCVPEDRGGLATLEAYIDNWVQFNTPPNISGYSRDSWTYDEFQATYDDVEVEVEYLPPEDPEPEKPPEPTPTGHAEYKFNYSAKGKFVQMVKYPRHIGSWTRTNAVGADPLTGEISFPSKHAYQGEVNVVQKDEGIFDVEGADVQPAEETFTVFYYPPYEDVDLNYEFLIVGMMGAVNSTAWRGYPAFTLQFVRCNGQLRSDTDWVIEFGFAYRPLETEDLKFLAWEDEGAPANHPWRWSIPAAKARPHDLIWFSWDIYTAGPNEPTAIRGRRWKVPVAGSIEQVWDYQDFRQLNIPDWRP